MGQKVNPNGLRVGIIRTWDSRWYAENNNVPQLLQEDLKIREFINEFYKNADVARTVIERSSNRIVVTVYSAKPGYVIGTDGANKKQALEQLTKLIKVNSKTKVFLNVKTVDKPKIEASLVAQSIATQLENRGNFRKVQKMAIREALKYGALGCKTCVSGRLGGVEMARKEGYSEGKVPLHTLRANVDYATATAHTTYGALGVKVWIYKGDVERGKKVEDLEQEDKSFQRKAGMARPQRRPQPKEEA